MSQNFGTVADQLGWKRKTLLYIPKFWYRCRPIGVKKKDPTVCPKILVRSSPKLGWKRKSLLWVPKFWYGREPIGVKKKDPTVWSKILVRSRTNWGEKERPYCMSQNFGTVANQLGWKRKTLLYVPKFWYGREPIGVKKKDPTVWTKILVRSRTNWGKKERPYCMCQNFGKVAN